MCVCVCIDVCVCAYVNIIYDVYDYLGTTLRIWVEGVIVLYISL